MTDNETLDTSRLKTLVDAGAVNYASARGVPGGFVLIVKVAMTERVIRAHRRTSPRIFATIQGLVNYCAAAGIRRFDVDLAGHGPAPSPGVEFRGAHRIRNK